MVVVDVVVIIAVVVGTLSLTLLKRYPMAAPIRIATTSPATTATFIGRDDYSQEGFTRSYQDDSETGPK